MKSKISELTPRRRQIVQLILEGLCDKEIAARLGIAHETVGGLIQLIFKETGTHSRTSLIAHFYEFTPKS